MKFKEWFNSATHRAKYADDHPAYLAAKEAWDEAHEACAKVCEAQKRGSLFHDKAVVQCSYAIRARGQE